MKTCLLFILAFSTFSMFQSIKMYNQTKFVIVLNQSLQLTLELSTNKDGVLTGILKAPNVSWIGVGFGNVMTSTNVITCFKTDSKCVARKPADKTTIPPAAVTTDYLASSSIATNGDFLEGTFTVDLTATPAAGNPNLNFNYTDLIWALNSDKTQVAMIKHTDKGILTNVSWGVCNSSCKTCDGASNTSCLTCDDEMWWDSGAKTCNPCHNTCKTCNGSAAADKCLSCEDELWLNGSSCSKCHNTCKTCNGSAAADKCLTCEDDLVFLSSNSSCVACNMACDGCTGAGADKCKKCEDGYFNMTNTSTCTKCHNSCKDCNGTAENNCLSCMSGYDFNSTAFTCNKSNKSSNTSSCKMNQYKKADNTCADCHKNCSNCSGPDVKDCIACADGIFKNPTMCNGKCHSTCKMCNGTTANNCTGCKVGNFLNSTNGTCIACDSNCLGCMNNATHCTSCTSPQALNSTNNCANCSATCKTCMGKVDECASCADNKWLNKKKCDACDATCAKCNGSSATMCTSCTAPKVLQTDKSCKTSGYLLMFGYSLIALMMTAIIFL